MRHATAYQLSWLLARVFRKLRLKPILSAPQKQLLLILGTHLPKHFRIAQKNASINVEKCYVLSGGDPDNQFLGALLSEFPPEASRMQR